MAINSIKKSSQPLRDGEQYMRESLTHTFLYMVEDMHCRDMDACEIIALISGCFQNALTDALDENDKSIMSDHDGVKMLHNLLNDLDDKKGKTVSRRKVIEAVEDVLGTFE